ncbi:hypothetical protein M0804_003444 [Polistes exclamans]|nr:hypothetical protein M0804_003444 [Polistes exclamans]
MRHCYFIFYPETLTALSLLDLLLNELQSELVGNIPLLFRQHLWIQLNACPIHYMVPIRQWINDVYSQR